MIGVAESHYQDAFSSYGAEGEILLFNENDNAAMLPIAAMPLLQKIDIFYSDVDNAIQVNGKLATDINEFVRRDASRESIPSLSAIAEKYQHGERLLLVVNQEKLEKLKAHFPMAKHLQPGAL